MGPVRSFFIGVFGVGASIVVAYWQLWAGVLLVTLGIAGYILTWAVHQWRAKSPDDTSEPGPLDPLNIATAVGSFSSSPTSIPAPAVNAGRDAVVSINQSGGVTAHTVTNVGLHPRALPVEQLPALRIRLAQYAGTPIRVITLALNPEAHRFATDIERLLKSAGWTITHPLNATLLEAPTPGVMVRSTAKTIDEIPAALNELGRCLKDAGFSVVVFAGAQEDGDSVVVYDNGSVNRSIFDAVVELP